MDIHSKVKDKQENSIDGVVRTYQYVGDRSELIIETEFADIKASVTDDEEYIVGDKVVIKINENKAIVF